MRVSRDPTEVAVLRAVKYGALARHPCTYDLYLCLQEQRAYKVLISIPQLPLTWFVIMHASRVVGPSASKPQAPRAPGPTIAPDHLCCCWQPMPTQWPMSGASLKRLNTNNKTFYPTWGSSRSCWSRMSLKPLRAASNDPNNGSQQQQQQQQALQPYQQQGTGDAAAIAAVPNDPAAFSQTLRDMGSQTW